MKRRTCKRAIRLFDDDNVDGTGEGGRVDLVVNMSEITDEFSQIIHPNLEPAIQTATTLESKKK